MPSGPSTAARTPFVLLVVLLLGGGLITLLLLNSSLNEGSFELSELKKKTTELTDQQQELQRDVDSYSAPGALERRARELGMVPGGSPAFLDQDGTVRGVPREASAQPTPDPSPMENRESVAPTPPAAAKARDPQVHQAHQGLQAVAHTREADPDDPRQVTQCPPRNHRGAGFRAPPGGRPRAPHSAARVPRSAAPRARSGSAAPAPGCGWSVSA
nr:septum formation initiator family protein [Streptomyces lunaelactis]